MSEISIGSALRQFIKEAHWDEKVHEISILENWEKIMGKTIAKYTDKIIYRNGILTIFTQIAPLKQDLLHNQNNIIRLVNEFLKDDVVKSVIVK